jgi:hypothetical protein
VQPGRGRTARIRPSVSLCDVAQQIGAEGQARAPEDVQDQRAFPITTAQGYSSWMNMSRALLMFLLYMPRSFADRICPRAPA